MNFKKYFLLLPLAALVGISILALAPREQPQVWSSLSQPMKEVEKLRKQFKYPKFKKKECPVTEFGAIGDGITLNTEAFKKAIEACHAKGGGRVIVPAGKFLTGAIYLKSNVNLHLQDNSTILFSRETKDYPIVLTRWEGMDCMNYSPLIYAYGEKNIGVTGTGVLDGNADDDHWWPWKGKEEHGWKKGAPNQAKARDALHEMMKQKIDPRQRVFGDGHYLRPYMLQPYNCKNVLISGVKMINSPMWFMSPTMCENVIIEKVHVESHGPNTDGCDPEACKNVWIKDCYFDTGDDCIAIKSGRDEDGRGFGRPAENHLIENCTMKDGHGGVVIGSEIAGGARNIYALNCNMSSKNLDRVLRIKTSSSRGGTIENIFMKDITVGSYAESAIHVNMYYENPGNFIPVVRNIWVENLEVTDGGDVAIWVKAYPESPVENLKLVNCHFKGVKAPFKVDHVKNMSLENVTVNGQVVRAPE